MPVKDRIPWVWSRRSLLVALAAGSVALLPACRVQLEEDAPLISVVPTRVPMKDEQALLAVLAGTTALASLASAVWGASTSLAGRLSDIHSTQADVIARLLREGGVPESPVPATPTSTTPTTAPPTSAPPTSAPPTSTPHTPAPLTTLAVLSAAEGESVREVELADLSSVHVALIGSMMAQRLAGLTLLGDRNEPVVLSGLEEDEAVRLLVATRSAVYGFEVVAAQIGTNAQAPALSTLASLRVRASELESLAGSTGTPAPLGYQLPFPVTNSDSARRLALHLLEALLASQAAALEPATGDATSLNDLVHWLGATEVTASRWGLPLAAFPGLKTSVDP